MIFRQKAFLIILSVAFVIILCGCSKDKKKPDSVEDNVEVFGYEDISHGQFLLTNGEGWVSILNIDENGGFSGDYHKKDMSDSGVEYNGTIANSSYTGTLSQPEQASELSYTATVDSIDHITIDEEGVIEDSIKYVNVKPYGIEKGAVVTIYLSGSDVSSMNEDFVNWIKRSYYFEGDKLPVTGLMIETSEGVFGWAMQGD